MLLQSELEKKIRSLNIDIDFRAKTAILWKIDTHDWLLKRQIVLSPYYANLYVTTRVYKYRTYIINGSPDVAI